jgi:hypothetical protein
MLTRSLRSTMPKTCAFSTADAVPLADGGFIVIWILFTEHSEAATKP